MAPTPKNPPFWHNRNRPREICVVEYVMHALESVVSIVENITFVLENLIHDVA